MRRVGLAWVLVAAMAVGAQAQERDAVRSAYFFAVAQHFELPHNEVSILGDSRLPADEIPVVLFVARRAGISAEALLALRRSGTGWAALAGRYQVGPGAFHVPLGDDTPAGRLEGVFAQYRQLPPTRWNEVRLTDADIVALVNLRVISESVGLPLGQILAQAGGSGSWVDLYGRLVGRR